jgi:hypothetical protein
LKNEERKKAKGEDVSHQVGNWIASVRWHDYIHDLLLSRVQEKRGRGSEKGARRERHEYQSLALALRMACKNYERVSKRIMNKMLSQTGE